MDLKPLPQAFGPALRDWRIRRHLSQMDLAIEAEISTRHLSFLETGRARPSREMVLKLAERLTAPMRERNALLSLAGFAAVRRPATTSSRPWCWTDPMGRCPSSRPRRCSERRWT